MTDAASGCTARNRVSVLALGWGLTLLLAASAIGQTSGPLAERLKSSPFKIVHECYVNDSPTYYQTSPDTDPHGPPNPGKDVKRVIRGGSYKSSADQCRATARQGERTGDTDACFSTDFCGFRCVRAASRKDILPMGVKRE
ncbi:MAG: hypothetical protein WCO56_00875 [Verrucomicrobiota bacterium]